MKIFIGKEMLCYVLCVIVVTLVSCETDNFPTEMQRDNTMQTSSGGINVRDLKNPVLIHLDSIYMDSSSISSQIKWYGRVENISGVTLTGSLSLYVKLYSDSLHTTIISTPNTWVNFIGFDPGEFYSFMIYSYVEQRFLPVFIPDSILIQ